MRFKNRRTFSFITALVMAFSMLLCGAAAEKTVSVKVNGTLLYDQARSMLSLINDFRTGDNAWYLSKDNHTKVAAKNLNALSYDYDLEKVAMQRAEEIAVYFNHNRPDGSSWKTIYPSGQISRGENIGYGTGGTVEDFFEAFCETDQDYSGQGHRRNMLRNEFTRVGFGAFESGGQVYWVQAFASGAAGGNAEDPYTDVFVETSWGVLGATGIQDVHASVDKITIEEGGSVSMPEINASSHTGASITFTDQAWQPKDSVIGVSGDQLVGAAQGDTTLHSTFGNVELEIPVSVASSAPENPPAPAAPPAGEKTQAESEQLSEAIPVDAGMEELIDYETPLGIPGIFRMMLDTEDECFDPAV